MHPHLDVYSYTLRLSGKLLMWARGEQNWCKSAGNQTEEGHLEHQIYLM